MIKQKNWLAAMLLTLVLALGADACSQTQVTPIPVTGGGSVTLDELVNDLKAAGATVETGDPANQPFFDAPGRVLKINGGELQVYEFVDEAARQAAQANISADASQIGEFLPNWVDQATFWGSGRLIAMYVGRDSALQKLVTNLMGAPVGQSPVVEGSQQGDQAAFEAQRQLAQRFAAAASDVTILSVEPAQWPDACLGVTGDNATCAQVITPGFKVSLSYDGRDWEARTNQTASVVRFPALP